MKSSSIKLIEAGIPNPREYRDCLIHEWYLQPQHKEKLSIFILRETVPSEFFFHLKDGELKVQGKSYSVTWCNSPPVIRESEFILISLRYCTHLERGYALVKELKGESSYERLEY